jgi:hypothetical protein
MSDRLQGYERVTRACIIGNIELPTYEIDVSNVGGKTRIGYSFSEYILAKLEADRFRDSLESGRIDPPVKETLL